MPQFNMKPKMSSTSKNTNTNTIILIVLIILAVLLVFQVLLLRSKIKTFAKNDYYKQSLVKNEYAYKNVESCANFAVYPWNVDTILFTAINNTDHKNRFMNHYEVKTFMYTVRRQATMSIETVPFTESTSNLTVVPVIKIGDNKFLNAFKNGKIEYIIWDKGGNMFAYRIDVIENVNLDEIYNGSTFNFQDSFRQNNYYYVILYKLQNANENFVQQIGFGITDFTQGFCIGSIPSTSTVTSTNFLNHVMGYTV